MKLQMIIFLTYFLQIGYSQIDTNAVMAQLDSLFEIAQVSSQSGAFSDAFIILDKAEKTTIEIFSKESAYYGDVCFFRGIVHKSKNEFDKAEKWFYEAKAVQIKVLGEGHPYYSATINTLGALYVEKGDFIKAEEKLLEAKQLKEKYQGKENEGYAVVLNNIGSFYQYIANYEKAEKVLLESKELYEKILGKEFDTYASVMNNLGGLYTEIGKFEKSEASYLQAATIREKLFSKNSPGYAIVMDNIAKMYQIMGNYEMAESKFLEALNIRKTTIGLSHPDYAISLNNCATLFRQMGKYDEAASYLSEANEILEKTLGKESDWYCSIQQNIITIQARKGNYLKAIEMQMELNKIWEKIAGSKSLKYSTALTLLASYNLNIGNLEVAENYFKEAASIEEKKFGKNHFSYATNLSYLAALYMEKGDYEMAKSLQLESNQITDHVFGKENISYASGEFDLALIYEKLGQTAKSAALFANSSKATCNNILKGLHHLTEQEMNQYIQTFATMQASILNFAQSTTNDTAIAQICFDNSLFFKGFLLNAYNQKKHVQLSNPSSQEQLDQLKSFSHLLAKEYAKPIDKRNGVKELEEKSKILEKEIARINKEYGQTMKQVTWQEVQKQLEPGEIVLDFVQYKKHPKKISDTIIYSVLLLKAGNDYPQLIPLFDKSQLVNLLSKNKDTKQVDQLYASRGIKQNSIVSLKNTYQLIWQPLDSMLLGVKKIFYSPTGLLHRINFDAIPLNEALHLSDKYELVRLSSLRTIAIPDLSNNELNYNAILYGGINFDPKDTQELLVINSVQSNENNEKLKNLSDYQNSLISFRRGIQLQGNNWNYLPGTEKECNAVSGILNRSKFVTNFLNGSMATEETFKLIGTNELSPKILHIATHGFFFPDPKESQQSSVVNPQEEPVFKMSDHPMIRSGLILAGGNYAWKEGKPFKEGMEDGILTAYEISQMNLSNTELVVLSACETGLGDIQGNEGVYGLQRAFKIAGAKYLMMSLWQVPDEETKEFMISFYRNWLYEKLSIPEAFRIAQKEMREKYSNPYLWAGFVLVE